MFLLDFVLCSLRTSVVFVRCSLAIALCFACFVLRLLLYFVCRANFLFVIQHDVVELKDAASDVVFIEGGDVVISFNLFHLVDISV